MISAADFQTRFPEFCEEDDERIDLFLGDAALFMGSEARWLRFFDLAQAYLAAHLLTVANVTEAGDSGVLAPIKKQEVDDVIIEQAVSSISVNQDEILTTSYGKRYYNYRRICFTGIYGV